MAGVRISLQMIRTPISTCRRTTPKVRGLTQTACLCTSMRVMSAAPQYQMDHQHQGGCDVYQTGHEILLLAAIRMGESIIPS